MNKILGAVFGVASVLALLSVSAQATSLLDWATSGSSRHAKSVEPADEATLLTLEPKQNEIYPHRGGARDFFVTVVARDRITLELRALENGDPLNSVSENPVPDSVQWQDGSILFLSSQVGGLGLWKKPAMGMGLVKRLFQFTGRVEQPTLLPNGDVIAVRLALRGVGEERRSSGRKDPFNNWSYRGAQSYIVRIDRDGGEKRLSDGGNPAVSPDGAWVVFSMAVGRSRHLFLMRSDGSELMQLTDGRAVDVQPAWSPDGQWIAFTSNRGHADMRSEKRSNWDVWLVSRDGQSMQRLTRNPARDGAPAFSADGKVVLFHSDRKISDEERELHGVRHANKGFHIWKVSVPVAGSAG